MPFEQRILDAMGDDEIHGFAVAERLETGPRGKKLVADGTLYRALKRLAAMGRLESRWEDPEIAEHANRPRRRLYRRPTPPAPGPADEGGA